MSLSESPRMWQWEFQTPASSQMEGIYDLYSDIMMILVAVAYFVIYILYYAVIEWRTAPKYDYLFAPEFKQETTLRQILVKAGPTVYFTHLAVVEFI